MNAPAAGGRVRVWDLPTRLCHWLLAAAVVLAVLSGQLGGGLIDWHGRIGVFVVGLVAFRLAWGFVGSTHSRFANFIPAPTDIAAYLQGRWRGLGHNPLGALSVLALLGLLGLQAGTGLFANDDIAFNGPLYPLVAKEFSDRLSGLHPLAAKALYGLVALHVGAILFHLLAKKDNLVKPMLTGWKETEAEAGQAAGGGAAAFVFALALAGLAAWGASGAWMAPPPPPPPAATPSW